MIQTKTAVTTQHWFDSPGDFVSEIERQRVKIDLYGSWSGNLTLSQIYQKMQRGDESYVAQAEKMIEEIMRGLRLETLKTEWQPDMCGAFADVPAFLAGDPSCMRRKVIVSREVAPMKLFICMSSSGGVDIKTLTQRGICLLALIIALTRIRPVELYTFNAGDMYTGYQSVTDLVRMPTSPMDVGLIAFIMANQAFTRGLCYSYIEHHQPGILATPPMRDMEKLRLLCNAQEDDIVFPPIHLYDEYTNPTKWVKDQLATILKLNEEQIEALT